jgi:hypothetical protein
VAKIWGVYTRRCEPRDLSTDAHGCERGWAWTHSRADDETRCDDARRNSHPSHPTPGDWSATEDIATVGGYGDSCAVVKSREGARTHLSQLAVELLQLLQELALRIPLAVLHVALRRWSIPTKATALISKRCPALYALSIVHLRTCLILLQVDGAPLGRWGRLPDPRWIHRPRRDPALPPATPDGGETEPLAEISVGMWPSCSPRVCMEV